MKVSNCRKSGSGTAVFNSSINSLKLRGLVRRGCFGLSGYLMMLELSSVVRKLADEKGTNGNTVVSPNKIVF